MDGMVDAVEAEAGVAGQAGNEEGHGGAGADEEPGQPGTAPTLPLLPPDHSHPDDRTGGPLPPRCPPGSIWLSVRVASTRLVGMGQPYRYTSPDEDSARWSGFAFRPGDIVISTRSKSGTTWMQMICLVLIFGSPALPGPLSQLSPWLDWLVEPRQSVVARLDAQQHRRCIKSHTPLDGLPIDERATYIVVAREPQPGADPSVHRTACAARASARSGAAG
jgi:hypothetical protein